MKSTKGERREKKETASFGPSIGISFVSDHASPTARLPKRGVVLAHRTGRGEKRDVLTEGKKGKRKKRKEKKKRERGRAA